MAGGAFDDAVGASHGRDEVHVEIHAQKGPRQTGCADALLGVPVVACEREGRAFGGAEKREIDDPSHAGSDGGV